MTWAARHLVTTRLRWHPDWWPLANFNAQMRCVYHVLAHHAAPASAAPAAAAATCASTGPTGALPRAAAARFAAVVARAAAKPFAARATRLPCASAQATVAAIAAAIPP